MHAAQPFLILVQSFLNAEGYPITRCEPAWEFLFFAIVHTRHPGLFLDPVIKSGLL